MTETVSCRLCGVPTLERRVLLPVFNEALNRVTGQYVVGTCAACADLRPDDEGSAVRAALRLIGRPDADPDLAARAFEDAGIDVAAVQFDTGRGRKDPNAKPWAHVPRDLRADLKRAFVAGLKARVHAREDRTAPPRPVPPPPEDALRGCAYCGVATVATEDQWARVTSHALSLARDRVVQGVLCSACTAAHNVVGAVGWRSWTLAFCEARGIVYRDDVPVPGLRPFALVADAEPSPAPWGHVADGVGYPEPPPTLAEQVAALAARVAALEEQARG